MNALAKLAAKIKGKILSIASFDHAKQVVVQDGLGHNHEWDELWAHCGINDEYRHVHGWVFCWICGDKERVENINKL